MLQSLLLYRFCFSFILFDTHVMLIVILSDVQYSQKAVFRFEKGLNGQSSSGPHHLVKKSPTPPSSSKISDSSPLGGFSSTPYRYLEKPESDATSTPIVNPIAVFDLQIGLMNSSIKGRMNRDLPHCLKIDFASIMLITS